MSKVAFCFPGQGRSRPAWAATSPRPCPRRWTCSSKAARRRASTWSSSASTRRSRTSSRRKCSSRRSSRRALRCSPRCAPRITPDYVVGHSVGEFTALAAAERDGHRGDDRPRAGARAATAEAARQRPGSMAAILGLEDEVVEELCRRILGVWPANYNCPGQIVISGEDDAVDECCSQASAHGARRTVKLRVSGAFHSPLVARAADRLKPAIHRSASTTRGCRSCPP